MACVEKLVKQRRESAKQFRAANREDLAVKEDQETEILKAYLPEPLSDDEVKSLIALGPDCKDFVGILLGCWLIGGWVVLPYQ